MKQEFLGSRAVAVLTAGVAGVLPFIYFSVTLDPVLAPTFMVLAVAVLGFFGWLAFKHKQLGFVSLPIHKGFSLVLLAFLLLNIVSLLYTSNVSDNWYEMSRWLLWLFLFAALSLIFQYNDRGLPAFVKAIVIGALLECLIGTIVIKPILVNILRNADPTYDVKGTFAHKNLYSSALMLMLPFCAYGIARLTKYWKVLATLACIWIVVIIVLVQTRAVWVGMALATIITSIPAAWLLLRRNNKGFASSNRAWLAGLITVVFMVLGLLFFKTTLFTHTYQRFTSTLNYNGPKTQANETVRERFFLWNNTWQMIKDHPVIGGGTGSWEIEFPKYGLENTRLEQGYVHFQRPHNDYLWVWSENGTIGLVVYLLIFLIPLYCIIRMLRKPDVGDPYLLLLLFFGIVSYMGDAFFCFPLERNTHLFLLIAMFALTITMYNREFPAAFSLSGPRLKSLIIAACIILPFVCLVGGLRISGERHSKLVYAAKMFRAYPAMVQHAEEAQSFAYRIDPMSAPMEWHRGTGLFMMDRIPAALEAYQNAYSLHPNHLPTLNNLASCYERLGQSGKAMEFYHKALSMSPVFEESLINLSAVHFNLRNTDSAYATISRVSITSINPMYEKNLNAILRVKTQLLVNSGTLDSAAVSEAMLIKAAPKQLKNIYLRARIEKMDFTRRLLKDLTE